MLEYLSIGLFILALITKISHMWFLKHGVTALPKMLNPVLELVDSVLTSSTANFEAVSATVTEDLTYLKDSCDHAKLRLYLFEKSWSDTTKTAKTLKLEKDNNELITFYRHSSEYVRVAILGVLNLQAKLLAIASYPGVNTDIKNSLLAVGKIKPSSFKSVLNLQYMVHTAAIKNNINIEVYGDYTSTEIVELLLANYEHSGTNVIPMAYGNHLKDKVELNQNWLAKKYKAT